MKNQWEHTYFYGHEISEDERQQGYINYSTLAKAVGSIILCNDITKLFYSTINGEYTEPELYNGSDYDEENDNYYDIYHYYIVSAYGAEILPDLDMYIWGVTHFGTMWSGVNTSIKIVNTKD